MTKTKWCCGVAVAALLIPVPVKADMFGADVAVLGQILIQSVKQVLQSAQMVSQGLKAYDQTRMAVAFVRSPGAWKTMMLNATDTISTRLGKPSTGHDMIALAQMANGRDAALQAIRQIANDPQWQPTAENTAQVSLLQLQALHATVQMNQLQERLNYDQQAAAYRAADPGTHTEDLTTWHLKQ